MIGKAGYAFFYPEIIHSLDIGIILSVIAGLVNYLAGHYMYRKGTKTQSITLVAGGHHLKSDAYSTVGIVIGLAIIYYTEFLWLDNVIALVFGGIIIFTGYKILKKSVAGIMDEVDNEVVETIAKGLGTNRMPNWVDVHNLRVIKYGSRLHVDCHLTLPYYFDIKKAHEEVAQVEMLIDNMFEDKVEVFIHTDACLTTQCAYCLKTDCAFRSAAFQNSITWTASNITKNQKHSLV
jgi:cation diffusion facilitator family transporter